MAKRKPSDSQPFFDHDVLSQKEQARWLGSPVERTKNLGHDSTVDRLTENPVGHPIEYDPRGVADRVINETRSAGVYGKFRDPQSGISSADNLKDWSGYAHSNSFDGRNPKGRGAGSDGHLLKPRGGYEFGSESGEGRLEKFRK